MQDCAGVWGGNDTINDYYFDADSDGLGAGDAVEFCSAFVADGYVTNADDEDDDCFSNSHDDCGVCDGGNADMDCAGVCFGSAYLDDCDVCSGGTTNHDGNSDQDCAGVCFGEAVVDDCGMCVGGTQPEELSYNWAQDCAGVCFGSAYLDNCDICSGGTTDHVGNSDQDCTGECFGTAIVDYCGVCTEGSTGLVANGDDLGCGCFAAGELEYWSDIDSDSWGSGDSGLFCAEIADITTDNSIFTLPPTGWVTNGDDNCPEISNEDQWNYDGDTQGDACDLDDDNDGAADDVDSDDNNEFVCSDDDGDTLSLIHI